MTKYYKKAKIWNYEYSLRKSDGWNLSHIKSRSTAPTPSSASAPSFGILLDTKGRASDQGLKGVFQLLRPYNRGMMLWMFLVIPKIEGFTIARQGQGGKKNRAQSKDLVAPAIVQLCMLFHLVRMSFIARIWCILSRLVRSKKILLIFSLVRYESFIYMLIHC